MDKKWPWIFLDKNIFDKKYAKYFTLFSKAKAECHSSVHYFTENKDIIFDKNIQNGIGIKYFEILFLKNKKNKISSKCNFTKHSKKIICL